MKTWLYLWGKPGLGRGEKKEKEGEKGKRPVLRYLCGAAVITILCPWALRDPNAGIYAVPGNYAGEFCQAQLAPAKRRAAQTGPGRA